MNTKTVGKGFKWRQRIGYGLLESGRFLADFLIQLYLMIYLTDVVLVPALAVGTMMLVCKLVDAVTDYTVGILVDRTNTRFGKSRPWSLFGAVVTTIGLILVFHTPLSLGAGGRLAYAAVTYTLYSSIGLTCLNIPEFTILPALTTEAKERTVLATCRQVFSNIINFSATYLCAGLLALFAATSGQGYPRVATVIALIVLTCELIAIAMVKEINLPESAEEKGEKKKAADKPKENPLKTSVKAFKEKNFWLFGIMASTISFSFVMTLTSGTYFFKYTMENPMLQATCMSSLSIAQFIGMFLCPWMNDKLPKQKLTFIGLVIMEVGYAAIFFGGTSQIMAIVAYFIFGLGSAIAFTMYFSLMPELFDFLEYKIGYSVSGITSSLVQYLVKIGNALCTTLVSVVLVIGHYDPLLDVQAEYTKMTLRVGISLVPGIIALIGIACTLFMSLDKQYDIVQKTLAERRGGAAEVAADDAAAEALAAEETDVAGDIAEKVAAEEAEEAEKKQ